MNLKLMVTIGLIGAAIEVLYRFFALIFGDSFYRFVMGEYGDRYWLIRMIEFIPALLFLIFFIMLKQGQRHGGR